MKGCVSLAVSPQKPARTCRWLDFISHGLALKVLVSPLWILKSRPRQMGHLIPKPPFLPQEGMCWLRFVKMFIQGL